MRRVLGLDLNGWRDFAARDWSVGIEEEQSSAPVRYLDGGIASAVVDFGDNQCVSGPQAILSPIGRGGGWGDIGNPTLRRDIADLWLALLSRDVGGAFDRQMRAAVDALSVSADDIVLTVPDRTDFDDERQQILLDTLSGRRRKPVRLLWRSVAMALSAIQQGLLPRQVEGLKILCVQHAAEGLEVQTLRLRRLVDHGGVFAPERAGPGAILAPAVGLQRLLDVARHQFSDRNPHLENENHEPSRLPMRMLLEGVKPDESEILRLANGRWVKAGAPEARTVEAFDLRKCFGDRECEVVLITTPLVDPWRGALLRAVRTAIGGAPLVEMPATANALGALAAGRRIEKGIPHYLDRLEQVSLIIMRDMEPVLEDLVPAEATAPANREYVSHPITNLSWPAGARSVDFYLRKGQEFRKWRTPDQSPPSERKRLEMRLRQTAAQGRAKLSATSADWDALRNNPIYLDWSTLSVDPRAFEEIADELRPKPVVPSRVTAKTHSETWRAPINGETLAEVVGRFSHLDDSSIRKLQLAMRRKYPVRKDLIDGAQAFGQFVYLHALDYDGAVAAGVDAPLVAKLDLVLSTIADRLRKAAVSGRWVLTSNDPLRAATWAFGRCPETLQDQMFEALKAHFQIKSHPLLVPRQSAMVLIHGLGRTVTDWTRLGQLLDLLTENLVRPHVIAALSMILSRPMATPTALDENRVTRIARSLAKLLNELFLRRSFSVNLKYALLAVGGLLRYREIVPFSLVSAKSADAVLLIQALRPILDALQAPSIAVSGLHYKVDLLREYIAALEGTGGKASLLIDTEFLEDADDDT
jgi:hypothetical protein